MSTKRRIGVSAATTEAARRALIQPVPCWEKLWVTPENAPAGSTLKIYRWVKTEKVQQFNDDEGNVDEPLAPLPDEPEVVDGDDDDQEEEKEPQTVPASARATEPPESRPNEPANGAQSQSRSQEPEESKPPSPKGPQLSLQMADENGFGDGENGLNGMDGTGVDADGKMDITMNEDGGMQLDISGLGPDGLSLEGTNMDQLDGGDALMGGTMMDNLEDPFGENQ